VGAHVDRRSLAKRPRTEIQSNIVALMRTYYPLKGLTTENTVKNRSRVFHVYFYAYNYASFHKKLKVTGKYIFHVLREFWLIFYVKGYYLRIGTGEILLIKIDST